MTKANGSKYWDAPLNFMTGCTNELPCWTRCWARSTHEARRKALLDPTNKFVNEMYRKPFSEIQLFHDKLAKGIPGGKPKTYFVDNTGDLFHPKVPGNFILRVMTRLAVCDRHRYLILTKRPGRMTRMGCNYQHMVKKTHLWFGATICNQREADENIIHLLRTPAVNRWLSIEPLLSEIDINKFILPGFKDVQGIFRDDWKLSGKWIVLGCESGKNRRPCKLDWVYSIVDQCQNAGVKVFVKQLDLDGKCVRDIKQFPKDLQIRDLPWKDEA